jgi:hypothetical protein
MPAILERRAPQQSVPRTAGVWPKPCGIGAGGPSAGPYTPATSRRPSAPRRSSCSARSINETWSGFSSRVRSCVHSLGVDWRARAQDVLARFRLDYGRHAGDADFLQLVERLSAVSPEFARWWPRFDVLPSIEGRKRYNYSVAGLIVAEHFTFSMTDNPDLRITVFSPAITWQGCAPRLHLNAMARG